MENLNEEIRRINSEMNTIGQASVEELLKPRYKVIADYPDSYYGTGDILYPMGSWNEIFMDKYPHLFKKLQWWEERKESDMPEYVKNSTAKQMNIIKVDSWFIEGKEYWAGYNKKQHLMLMYGYLPATKEEYLNQKQ